MSLCKCTRGSARVARVLKLSRERRTTPITFSFSTGNITARFVVRRPGCGLYIPCDKRCTGVVRATCVYTVQLCRHAISVLFIPLSGNRTFSSSGKRIDGMHLSKGQIFLQGVIGLSRQRRHVFSLNSYRRWIFLFPVLSRALNFGSALQTASKQGNKIYKAKCSALLVVYRVLWRII